MRTKFLLLAVVFSFVFSGLKAQVDVGDSLALVDLYNSTNGANWVNHTNWLTKASVSTWSGITVTGNRVTDVSLQYNQLTGSLPNSIGNLTQVVTLALYVNNLRGMLPASVGNMSSLVYLELYYNKFSGTIPASLTQLTKLKVIGLDDNEFTGEIPIKIGNLREADGIYLQHNKLSGSIPTSIGNLYKATYIDLSYNKLTDGIPATLGNDTLLVILFLNNNNLTDTIPASVGNLTKLTNLSFKQNQLSGIIPESFGNLVNMFNLHLNNNQLTGRIPASMGHLRNMQFLDVRYNHLSENLNNNPDKDFYISLDLRYNNYTFNGLEYLAIHTSNGIYSPQANINIHHFKAGLAVSAGGTLSNNTYTWFQVGKGTGSVVMGDSTFTPMESGSYYCNIRNKIATQLTLHTDTVTYITNPVVKNTLKISVSPNPVRELISIHGLKGKSNAKITIADMSGYVWMKAMSHEQSAMKIDVSRLKAGNYLVNVNDGKEVKTLMFVKE